MASMPNLQWRLTPYDAQVVLRILDSAYLTGLDEPDRLHARVLAAYLRHRVARLWGPTALAPAAAWRERINSVPDTDWHGIDGAD